MAFTGAVEAKAWSSECRVPRSRGHVSASVDDEVIDKTYEEITFAIKDRQTERQEPPATPGPKGQDFE